MDFQEAKKRVEEIFPFKGYMDHGVDSYKIIAEIAKKYLSPSSRILDFGAGACDKVGVLQAMGYNCTAVDDLQDHWHQLGNNSQKIIEFASEMGIDFHRLVGEGVPFENNYFDMVMMHDVLEHLHDSPRLLLNRLVETIKPGGYLFITVPNLSFIGCRLKLLFGKTNLPEFETFYWYPGQWRGHIREYVKDDLDQLLKNLELKKIELRGVHILINRKKERFPKLVVSGYLFLTNFFPNMRDSWLFVAKKPKNWVAKSELPVSQLNKILAAASPYYGSGNEGVLSAGVHK